MREVALVAILVLGACFAGQPHLAVEDTADTVIEYPYEEVDTTEWAAPIDFCMRHYEASKVTPAYAVEICINECKRNPEHEWCVDDN